MHQKNEVAQVRMSNRFILIKRILTLRNEKTRIFMFKFGNRTESHTSHCGKVGEDENLVQEGFVRL